jgi:DNA polymerase I-like protein with 3'-5' exonuclease and polymerase domains
MLIDQEKVEEVDAMCNRELTPEKLHLLIYNKILIPAQPAMPYANGARGIDGQPKMKQPTKPKIKKKLLQQWVLDVCKQQDIKVKLTDKAKKLLSVTSIEADHPKMDVKFVSTDAEVISGLAPHDALIKQYQHRQKLQKLVTTYLPHLRGTATIHPEFDVLKETGRTSSYASSLYPSNNVQQEDPRTRPCFVARPGYVLVSVDYAAIELVSLAQKCYTLFGHSVLRDMVNAGVDLHAYLGSGIAYKKDPGFQQMVQDTAKEVDRIDPAKPLDVYEVFLSQKKADPDFYKKWRTLAKPVGLGFPGGMGIDTFVTMARNSYGVIITRDEAQELKDIWLETYPEMNDYFAWIREECLDPNNVGTDEDGDPTKLYSYISPLGMYRAGATYCAAANGASLQTPTAEGAKSGVFKIARACYDPAVSSILYDSRPVAFIHDENLAEIREDEHMHDRAFAIATIMIEAMQKVMPDVKIGAEPALMRRWDKRAEAVYDEHGVIQVWEPKELLA